MTKHLVLECLLLLCKIPHPADSPLGCGTADGQSAPAVRAACTARRWIARNAEGVKRIRGWTHLEAAKAVLACASLVFCLPALEDVTICFHEWLNPHELSCLLEALAWSPRLSALDLDMRDHWMRDDADGAPFAASGCASAFAQLRSLKRLALCVGIAVPYTLADVVGALVPLTGLAELTLGILRAAAVPAALGQLKGLRTLELQGLQFGVFEADCFDLPNLVSLVFRGCSLEGMVPGVTAIQSLTRIEFGGIGPPFFDAQLAELPRLQRMVCSTSEPCPRGACLWLSRPRPHMGTLSSTLLHLDLSGHELTQFPLALLQLVALKSLVAEENEFAELPSGITALSRLTELALGRAWRERDYPFQQRKKRHLDLRALGDLSGFPALSVLRFEYCEVTMCTSMPGAVRHASLTSMQFCMSHPAPECAIMLLQLGQALNQVKRGSVLRVYDLGFGVAEQGYEDEQLAPLFMFKIALQACGLNISVTDMGPCRVVHALV